MDDLNKQKKTNKFYVDIQFIKQILLFIFGWMGFQVIGSIIQNVAILIYSKTISEIGLKEFFALPGTGMAINSLAYVIVAIILFSIVNVDLKKFKDSFASWKPYLAGAIGFFALIAFSVAYSIFLSLIGVKISNNENQEAIDAVTVSYPIISLIVFGIIGPICEEFTYRVGLFSSIRRKNRVLAYVVTILVFALIHFTAGGDIKTELINLPIYAFAGFTLSFLYDHWGLGASLTTHIINNLYATLAVATIHNWIH